MSKKSELGEKLDILQKHVKILMKDQGFRSQGRTFNKTTEEGLSLVVNFQMGNFDPPGTVYNQIKQNLNGSFTVNLGVYISEVADGRGIIAKGFIQEPYCHIRKRLGRLGPEREDIWWSIGTDQLLFEEIDLRIRRDALPFLDQFSTRNKILEYYDRFGFIDGTLTPRIVCALILNKEGDTRSAARLMFEQIQEAREEGRTSHIEYIQTLATRLNLELDL